MEGPLLSILHCNHLIWIAMRAGQLSNIAQEEDTSGRALDNPVSKTTARQQRVWAPCQASVWLANAQCIILVDHIPKKRIGNKEMQTMREIVMLSTVQDRS